VDPVSSGPGIVSGKASKIRLLSWLMVTWETRTIFCFLVFYIFMGPKCPHWWMLQSLHQGGILVNTKGQFCQLWCSVVGVFVWYFALCNVRVAVWHSTLAFWLFQTAWPRRIPFGSVFCLIIYPSFVSMSLFFLFLSPPSNKHVQIYACLWSV